jgi:mRNA interferase MazF
VIYRKFDVVIIPFPFSDRLEQKRRPALVISADEFNQQCRHFVAVMITSAKRSEWPWDVVIRDLGPAGLPCDCRVRMKFFTADQALVDKKIGRISPRDQKAVQASLSGVIG